MNISALWQQLQHYLDGPLVGRLVSAFLILAVMLLLMRLARRAAFRTIESKSSLYTARRTISVIGWLLIVLFLVALFGDKLGTIAVSLGVIGAGVAFALQEVIASLAGRFAILFARFYSVGDRIELGGIRGDVIDIGFLRTTLMEIGNWVKGDNYTGRIVRIANSFVFKEPVFNASADFAFLWDEITVPVKYGCDIREARQILESAVKDVAGGFVEASATEWKRMNELYRVEDARVEPLVTLMANDNWIEFTVRYVVPFVQRRVTKDRLFTRILEDFDRTEGRVGIASMTVHLVETPQIKVQVVRD